MFALKLKVWQAGVNLIGNPTKNCACLSSGSVIYRTDEFLGFSCEKLLNNCTF